jgi:hypothetical protein
VARKDDAPQDASLSPNLYGVTLDPCTHNRDPRLRSETPSEGPQVPPSKVRTTTRSRDRGNPSMSKGPVLARVQALPCVLALPAQAETRYCRVACGP